MSKKDSAFNDMARRIRAAAISVRRNGWPYGEWTQHVARIAATGSDKTPEDFVAFMHNFSLATRKALKSRPHTIFRRLESHTDRDGEREDRIRAQYEEAIKTLGEHVTVSSIAQKIGKEEFVVRSYLRQHPDLGRRVLSG